jgi:hypothetical protein
MLGIPMEMVPAYPTGANTIFLTASAAFGPQIVAKINESVRNGGHVVITSGLLKKLAGKGLNDIAELEATDQKIAVNEYMARFRFIQGTSKILFPEILFATNDAWSDVSGISGAMGYPILLEASYGKGALDVLAIPDNPADLYLLPAEVLDPIKRAMLRESWIRTETPAKIALFTYDNKTAVIESFLDSSELVTIVTDKSITKLQEFESGRVLNGEARGTKWYSAPSCSRTGSRCFRRSRVAGRGGRDSRSRFCGTTNAWPSLQEINCPARSRTFKSGTSWPMLS